MSARQRLDRDASILAGEFGAQADDFEKLAAPGRSDSLATFRHLWLNAQNEAGRLLLSAIEQGWLASLVQRADDLRRYKPDLKPDERPWIGDVDTPAGAFMAVSGGVDFADSSKGSKPPIKGKRGGVVVRPGAAVLNIHVYSGLLNEAYPWSVTEDLRFYFSPHRLIGGRRNGIDCWYIGNRIILKRQARACRILAELVSVVEPGDRPSQRATRAQKRETQGSQHALVERPADTNRESATPGKPSDAHPTDMEEEARMLDLAESSIFIDRTNEGEHGRALADFLRGYAGTVHEQEIFDEYHRFKPGDGATAVEGRADHEQIGFHEYFARQMLAHLREFARRRGIENAQASSAESHRDSTTQPMTTNQLEEALEVSGETIRRWREAAGVSPRERRDQSFSGQEVAAILESMANHARRKNTRELARRMMKNGDVARQRPT